jgi:hypothetical protein
MSESALRGWFWTGVVALSLAAWIVWYIAGGTWQ